MKEKELFILKMKNDKNELEYFYFSWDNSKITIEQICDEVKVQKRFCEENNIRYNHILAIRKLEELGLKQIPAEILTVLTED